MALLNVNDLNVSFPLPDGIIKAVNGISFALNSGENFRYSW